MISNNQITALSGAIHDCNSIIDESLKLLNAGKPQDAVKKMRLGGGSIAEAEMQTRTMNERLRNLV